MSLVTLKVRSPIHVGGPEGAVDTAELAVVGDQAYRVSTVGLEDWLHDHGLVPAYLRASEEAVGRPFSLPGFLRAQGMVPSEVLPTVAEYAVAVPADANIAHVRTFCRHPDGSPYLPGTTIKGAFRTAALARQLSAEAPLGEALVRAASQARPSDRWAARDVEREAFSRLRFPDHLRVTPLHRDLWRFVRVRDSVPIKPEHVAIMEVVVWSRRRDGTPYEKASLYAECLVPGTEVRFGLDVDQEALQRCRAAFSWATPEGLLDAAAEWARTVWAGETESLASLGHAAHLAGFYADTPAGIRLGWGSGWHSLGVGRLLPTGLQRRLAPRDQEGQPFPKTRKTAVIAVGNLLPLGWGDLSVI